MSSDSIVIEIFYPFQIERVWAALSSREALSAWLMPNDFEPRVGHRFTFRTTGDSRWSGVVSCEVTALEAPRRIAFTWRNEGTLDTLVTFTLEPAEGGTNLQLVHSGFAATGERGLTVRDFLATGWNSTILRERLPAFLDAQANHQ